MLQVAMKWIRKFLTTVLMSSNSLDRWSSVCSAAKRENQNDENRVHARQQSQRGSIA